MCGCFFFNDTATTEIYTLSLHDALPISPGHRDLHRAGRLRRGTGGGPRPGRRRRRARVGLPLRPEGVPGAAPAGRRGHRDRKSTRLNSSHANISYAVFCLKKKNTPPPSILSDSLSRFPHSLSFFLFPSPPLTSSPFLSPPSYSLYSFLPPFLPPLTPPPLL